MIKKYNQAIGIIGGMGSYATAHFFRRLIDAFPAEKEWDRPRIVIDNRCTLPSRVRVFLYRDPIEYEELISSLADSARGLLEFGVDYLIFTCNTAHIFLEDVFERVPEARSKTINIIETLGNELKNNNVGSAYLLASEGTIDSKIFPKVFKKYGVRITSPTQEDYADIRYFIEQVKQSNSGEACKIKFLDYCKSLDSDNIILGCTELPVITNNTELYEGVSIWDPLTSVIREIKRRIN